MNPRSGLASLYALAMSLVVAASLGTWFVIAYALIAGPWLGVQIAKHHA